MRSDGEQSRYMSFRNSQKNIRRACKKLEHFAGFFTNVAILELLLQSTQNQIAKIHENVYNFIDFKRRIDDESLQY